MPKMLGFAGILIHNHSSQPFYDSPTYNPYFLDPRIDSSIIKLRLFIEDIP